MIRSWTAILMLVAGALLTVTTGLWAMQELEQFGPSVGGVIVFKPDTAASEQWSVDGAIVDPVHAGVTDGFRTKHAFSAHASWSPAGAVLSIEARRHEQPAAVSRALGRQSHQQHAWRLRHVSRPCAVRSGLMRLADMAGGFGMISG